MPPPPTFFIFIILILFSCTPRHLTCTTIHNRRILHQSFFPNQYPSPPTQPPSSPPPQDYPFTPTTPSDQSPFFPSYPSPPPPPPSTTLASFPANVSSLSLPHSPTHKSLSPKLLSLSIISLFLAFLLSSIALLLILRKCHRLNNQKNVPTRPTDSHNGQSRARVRTENANKTSSEFLYLGTLVNSRTQQGHLGNTNLNASKLDSPELHPLPPLNNTTSGQSVTNSREQVYSTGGNLETFEGRNGRNYGYSSSSTSTTSSGSSSPNRSVSITISPAISLSPKRQFPKSPDLLEMDAPPPHLPSKKPIITEWDCDSNSSLSSSSSSLSSSLERNIEAKPNGSTPPPPPPPLPKVINSQPPASKPPPLITPSRPFIVSNEKMEETLKPKLKPLHWDKVRASSGREMVWDQLKFSSFELNEEMIETLFVLNNSNLNPKEAGRSSALPSSNQENRVLDPKKSQNISILLRALNVTTEEVCEALLEGNADSLGAELLESLLKMSPTKEEARKLKEYKDDAPLKLDPAERFLKAVLSIPFAFKRIEAMLYIGNFDSEVEYMMQSFETLEAASEELRNNRMFLKLLEAVLKTGNRMNIGTNRGDAQAFKLDTLLKLVDVKGADGKTTLLHFVVQEIIKAEGARILRTDETPKSTMNEDARCRNLGLQVVSGLSSDLTNVKKAACMDSDVLSSDVSKLSRGIELVREILQLNESGALDESSHKFSKSMHIFVSKAEGTITKVQAQESVSLSVVKEITEYFHGNSAQEEAHPFRIFMVVRDFLTILDRVCKEVALINERTLVSSVNKFPVPVNPTVPAAFHGRQQGSSSSDDESSSP